MLPGLRSRGDAERRGQRQAAFLAGTQRNWAAAEPAPPRPWTGPAARLRPRLARLHLPDAPLQPQQSRTRPARAAAPGPPPSPGPSSAHARPGTTEAARWGDLGPQSHSTCWDQAEAIGHQAEARQRSGSERGPQCWARRGRGREGGMAKVSGLALPSSHGATADSRPLLGGGITSGGVGSSSAFASQSRCWKLRLSPPCHPGFTASSGFQGVQSPSFLPVWVQLWKKASALNAGKPRALDLVFSIIYFPYLYFK